MPEELNRVETDRLSDLLFAPSPAAARTLREEGVRGTIHVTGDPMCDILESRRHDVEAAPGTYLLATVHRNYNTDAPERLRAVLACLARSPWPVRFPVHPRTRARIEEWDLEIPPGVELLAPASYTEMLSLERGAQAIATDSGGVQREAYLWGVPCVTLREETEWLDTVETGWNTLVGVDPERFAAALDRPRPGQRPPVLGDGNAAARIAELTIAWLADNLEEAA
jgi:UDP-N-acetylglucosamine 2-epimerase